MINLPRRANLDLKSQVLEKKTKASLSRAHFEHLAQDYEHMVKLLRQGLRARTRGLNLLLYGPPGTGKTELAKTLAAEIEADLYPVSETSNENRVSARRSELQMARALLAGDRKAMLLVDEAEEIFVGGRSQTDGNSKLFFNRLLEKNETPVIWITNNVEDFNPAYLRRFSYALEVKTPPAPARARIWRDELTRKKIRMSEKEIEVLTKNYELPPSFAVSAINAAHLLQDKDAIERTLAVWNTPLPVAPN